MILTKNVLVLLRDTEKERLIAQPMKRRKGYRLLFFPSSFFAPFKFKQHHVFYLHFKLPADGALEGVKV